MKSTTVLRNAAMQSAALLLYQEAGDILRLSRPRIIVTTRDEARRLKAYQRRYEAWTQKQYEAWAATQTETWVLFGGGKAGAKTVGGVRIAQTNIARSSGGVHLVARRNYTDLLKTTQQSYEQYFPEALIVRKTERVWYCKNDWQIWFYASDDRNDPNFEKLGGMEVSTVHPDEVSQFPEGFYEVVPSTLRRPAYLLNGEGAINPHVFATCNPIPTAHWSKRYFIDKDTRRGHDFIGSTGHRIGHVFIQSLIDTNPLAPEGYEEQAFGTMTGARLQMLRHGRWDIAASEFQIVPVADLLTLYTKKSIDGTYVAMGCDIGLGSPDMTTLYGVTRTGHMERIMSVSEYDTMQQVAMLSPWVAMVKAAHGQFWIDQSGVGKGVCDRLLEIFGSCVVGVSFGSAPEKVRDGSHEQFLNRRSQMYWMAREQVMINAEMIRHGDDPKLQITENKDLQTDFENTFYLPTEGKIQVEPKDNIKERIGHSPDDADAAVLCIGAWQAGVSDPIISPRKSERSRTSITQGY